MRRAAGMSLPRLQLCLKWLIVCCAAFILASNILYFGLDLRTLPGKLPRRLSSVTSFTSSAEQQKSDKVDWEALVDKVTTSNKSQGTKGAKALLLCEDVDPTCPTLVKAGGCRPIDLRLDVPMKQCRASCGLCSSLALTLSQQLELPVDAVSEPGAWAGSCSDQGPAEQCAAWAGEGLCSSKPKRMLMTCKATCHFCSPAPTPSAPPPTSASCLDAVDVCPYLANALELCASSRHWWMPLLCARSCQECKAEEGAPSAPVKLLADMTTLRSSKECADYNGMCETWKAQHKCENDRQYMMAVCARSCDLCTSRSLAATSSSSSSPSPSPVGPVVLGTDSSHSLTSTAYIQSSSTCFDETASCEGWAAAKQCIINAAYMLVACKRACGVCTPVDKFMQRPLTQVLLNNGVLMPTVGFGTAGLGDGTRAAVEEALKAGYRHIDSAQAYEWYRESAVGAALAASGVPRSSVFLTTKTHPKNLGFNATLAAFQQSLLDLGTDYVDLLLLHYPRCWDGLPGCVKGGGGGTWQESWKALEHLAGVQAREGRGGARAIGVSNFDVTELRALLAAAAVRPAVVQVRVDPLAGDAALLGLCSGLGVQVEAYSALGTQWPLVPAAGGALVNPVLSERRIVALAARLGRSPAQVVLRWALQLGLVVLPRSANAGRMRENLDVWGFELSGVDMETMASVRSGA